MLRGAITMKTQVLTENGLNIYDQEIKTYIDNNKVQAIEFSLRVDENGYLICDYPEGTEPPDLSINEDGFLVYTY